MEYTNDYKDYCVSAGLDFNLKSSFDNYIEWITNDIENNIKLSDVLYITYIGESEFSEFELKCIKNDQIVTGITNYSYGDRNGQGIFVAVDRNGKWKLYNVGHCSCYGPLESGYSGLFTKEEIIKLVNESENYDASKSDKTLIIDFINKH